MEGVVYCTSGLLEKGCGLLEEGCGLIHVEGCSLLGRMGAVYWGGGVWSTAHQGAGDL